MNEDKKDDQKVTTNYYYIGYIYMLMADMEKALDYSNSSVNTAKESK